MNTEERSGLAIGWCAREDRKLSDVLMPLAEKCGLAHIEKGDLVYALGDYFFDKAIDKARELDLHLVLHLDLDAGNFEIIHNENGFSFFALFIEKGDLELDEYKQLLDLGHDVINSFIKDVDIESPLIFPVCYTPPE